MSNFFDKFRVLEVNIMLNLHPHFFIIQNLYNNISCIPVMDGNRHCFFCPHLLCWKIHIEQKNLYDIVILISM